MAAAANGNGGAALGQAATAPLPAGTAPQALPSLLPTPPPPQQPTLSLGAMSPAQLQQLKAQVWLYQALSHQQTVPNKALHRATRAAAGTLVSPLELQDDTRRVEEALVEGRIRARQAALEALPASLPADLKMSGLLELRALRLLSTQRKIRREMATIHTAPDHEAAAFRRSAFVKGRVINMRDASKTQIAEQRRKQDHARRVRQRHHEHLRAVLVHGEQFRAFHSEVRDRASDLAHRVASSLDKEKQKEQDEQARLQTERMKRLMEEDEEGYRALVNTQKNARLQHLLHKTDEYMVSMAELVRQHQEENSAAIASEQTGAAAATEDGAAAAAMEGTTEESDEAAAEAAAPEPKPTDYDQIAHAIKEKVEKQPGNLAFGTLKEYQVIGLEWLVSLYNNRLNGILADEMGLGKTIQTIALLCFLAESKNNRGPHLVIVPLATLSNWQMEFDKWSPTINVISYYGGKNARRVHHDRIHQGRFNVLLTTYDYVIRDKTVLSRISWKYMIIDEGHRMKNHHCKLTQTLTQNYDTRNRLLLTGTPLQNNLPELWSLLNFLLPKIFKSVESFEQWFNAPFAGTTEAAVLSEEETLLIIRRLHKILRPFLLRRLKKEVATQLPDKVEYVVNCEMSGLQKRLYRHMQKHRAILTDGTEKAVKVKGPPGGAKAVANTIMQLRKICNHPFIFTTIEHGLDAHLQGSVDNYDLMRACGKFELLSRIVPKLQKTGHRMLLFSGSTKLLTVLEDFLVHLGVQYLRMDGNTKSEERGTMLKSFNAEGSPYDMFLLSTRAGGLGLNLQTADTVIIYDSDWNPHQDLQAQDRAHRIGQTKEVRVLRLITRNSVEEKILETAKFKLNVDEKVIQAGKFNTNSTDLDSKNYLQALLENDLEEKEETAEAVTYDQLNEFLSRSEDEFDLFQKMDEEMVEDDKVWQNERRQERLMQTSELPEWMMQADEAVASAIEAAKPDLKLVRGQRSTRSDIDYGHELTEHQFLKAVEEGDLQGAQDRQRKKRKRQSSGAGPASTTTPARTLKRPKLDADALTDSSRRLIAILKELCEFEQDGELVAELFLELPSAEDYPEYYEVISQPIALDIIQSRAEAGDYASFADCRRDLELMSLNAHTFNQEGSEVCADVNAVLAQFDVLSSGAQDSRGKRRKQRPKRPLDL